MEKGHRNLIAVLLTVSIFGIAFLEQFLQALLEELIELVDTIKINGIIVPVETLQNFTGMITVAIIACLLVTIAIVFLETSEKDSE